MLNYLNPSGRLGNLTGTIQLLESFGKVKVLSSPKISVMNNQTALLKVVDNNVFFSIKVTPAVLGSTGTPISQAVYESKLETVPVGFVMSVTPQIADNDEVTINVRPTITRIVGYVKDPNPALATANVESRVPVIQARELESLMKVPSGGGVWMQAPKYGTSRNSRIPLSALSSGTMKPGIFTCRPSNEATVGASSQTLRMRSYSSCTRGSESGSALSFCRSSNDFIGSQLRGTSASQLISENGAACSQGVAPRHREAARPCNRRRRAIGAEVRGVNIASDSRRQAIGQRQAVGAPARQQTGKPAREQQPGEQQPLQGRSLPQMQRQAKACL